jgi:hypothetical protein
MIPVKHLHANSSYARIRGGGGTCHTALCVTFARKMAHVVVTPVLTVVIVSVQTELISRIMEV